MEQAASPQNDRFLQAAKVLIVDDRPGNLLALRVLLEGLNAEIVEAQSGEAALMLLGSLDFAAVLLDVVMPDINGFEVARRIREMPHRQHVPILFISAADIDRQQMKEGYRLGAVDFLIKPIKDYILQAKVRGFIDLFNDAQRARSEADQLRMLIHGTIDYAIFMLDPKGYVVTWNPGAQRLNGYLASEIVGQHVSLFYPEEARDAGLPEQELKVAAMEGRLEDEGWRIRKDGSRFWAHVVTTALRDVEGRLKGFSKVTRDLSNRKDVEERLRRSDERFRLLVESAKDYAIFMLDPQGIIISWNEGAERIKQYKASEIIGEHFSRFYPQEARDRGWPEYELKVAAAEGRFEDEGWRVRKDGSVFWANVVITALKDSEGGLRGFSKITRDMTARKESEERARQLAEEATARRLAEENARIVREQRERLQVTLASIGDAVICTDAEGRVEFLNSVAEKLTGWSTEEARNLPLTDIFHIVNESTRSPVVNPALRAIREGTIVGLANHTVLIARDGTQRPIDDSAAPIRDSDGKILGSVLVFRDITERKRNEQAARFLADASAALAILVDFDSTLQKVASLAVPQFADWTTVDLVERDGALRRVAVAHADVSKVELARELHRRFPSDPAAGRGSGYVARTGNVELVSEITDEMLVANITNAEQLASLRSLGLKSYMGVPLKVRGRTIGVMSFVSAESGYHYTAADLTIAQDLAERCAIAIDNARLYRELREQDRRKDEFLATLAHELRNPLAPIRNSLQILKLSRVDTEVAQQTREMMERQIHHLVRLVDDLLDVSRVMRGKIELRKEMVELATIIARAVETAKPLIEAHGHRLQVDVSPETLPLEADPVRLVQAFGNLLNNSAKYSDDNGYIHVTARAERGEAIVTILDHGIGIAPDMLPHIFELFVQADHTSAKAQGGLGIGLTLVKNLIEMHGGSISAQSEGLGRGAEFTVRLPLATKPVELTRRDEIARQTHGQAHRIMVVDDNRDAALSLSMLLKLDGHHVTVAHDGKTALELAASVVPEAIFLDIGMPGMDGFEVARRIRATPQLAKIRLVALTGWGQQEDRRRTFEAGFDFHLVKPPEPADINGIMQSLNHR